MVVDGCSGVVDVDGGGGFKQRLMAVVAGTEERKRDGSPSQQRE